MSSTSRRREQVGRALALARPRVVRAVLAGRGAGSASDLEHLEAAILWLRDAQAAVPGGVAARYDLARGWQPAYPETSGYIVGTLLHHAAVTGQTGAVARAEAIGEWLLGIQQPAGFIAGGLAGDDGSSGDRPSVFNTGQVVFGFVALAQHSGDERFADAARRASSWLVEQQDADGSWTRGSLQGIPRAYYARVGWALARASVLLDEPAFATAARRSAGWVVDGAEDDGWIGHVSFTPGKPALTHTIAYTIEGLLETALTVPDVDRAFDVAWRACRALRESWESDPAARRGRDVVASFGRGWSPAARFSCVTGSAQLALCCARLHQFRDDPDLAAWGDALLDAAKATQPRHGPVGIRGGTPGSAPLWGEYGSFRYLNWAAKFLADALLQRISGGLPRSRFG